MKNFHDIERSVGSEHDRRGGEICDLPRCPVDNANIADPRLHPPRHFHGHSLRLLHRNQPAASSPG